MYQVAGHAAPRVAHVSGVGRGHLDVAAHQQPGAVGGPVTRAPASVRVDVARADVREQLLEIPADANRQGRPQQCIVGAHDIRVDDVAVDRSVQRFGAEHPNDGRQQVEQIGARKAARDHPLGTRHLGGASEDETKLDVGGRVAIDPEQARPENDDGSRDTHELDIGGVGHGGGVQDGRRHVKRRRHAWEDISSARRSRGAHASRADDATSLEGIFWIGPQQRCGFPQNGEQPRHAALVGAADELMAQVLAQHTPVGLVPGHLVR